MNRGPQRTNLSKFQGFGFGFKPSGGSAPASSTKPVARPGAPAKATGNVAALFRDSLEHDSNGGATTSLPSWSKPSIEAVQARRQAEILQTEDPTIFQYDEVIDDIKEDLDLQSITQNVRTDALQQKKRIGLTVPSGADGVKTGTKRQAKYIEKVLVATDRRKVEQQIIEDRLLKKEKEQNKDCEVFVTEAFKEELKRRKKFEDDLQEQELRDQQRAADKQEHGSGFADMYRNLLNGGLATSRGGEKQKEKEPARIELPNDEPGSETNDVKEEASKQEDVEAQTAENNGKEGEHKAPPLDPSEVRKAKEEAAKAAQEARESKALSARERYLARKQGQAT